MRRRGKKKKQNTTEEGYKGKIKIIKKKTKQKSKKRDMVY